MAGVTEVPTYDPARNASPPFMTRFEAAAIKGMRCEQLSKGAPTMLTDAERVGLTDVREVMEKEFALKKIPYMVLRTMPNNDKELWKLKDLTVLQ